MYSFRSDMIQAMKRISLSQLSEIKTCLKPVQQIMQQHDFTSSSQQIFYLEKKGQNNNDNPPHKMALTCKVFLPHSYIISDILSSHLVCCSDVFLVCTLTTLAPPSSISETSFVVDST